jgi:hypothetical protein
VIKTIIAGADLTHALDRQLLAAERLRMAKAALRKPTR